MHIVFLRDAQENGTTLGKGLKYITSRFAAMLHCSGPKGEQSKERPQGMNAFRTKQSLLHSSEEQHPELPQTGSSLAAAKKSNYFADMGSLWRRAWEQQGCRHRKQPCPDVKMQLSSWEKT